MKKMSGAEVARVSSVALEELITLAKEGDEPMLAYLLKMALSECEDILSEANRPSPVLAPWMASSKRKAGSV